MYPKMWLKWISVFFLIIWMVLLMKNTLLIKKSLLENVNLL